MGKQIQPDVEVALLEAQEKDFEEVAQDWVDATLAPWMPATHGALYDKHEGNFEVSRSERRRCQDWISCTILYGH